MGILNRTGAEIDYQLEKNAKKSFLLLKKLKNTESAKLWSINYTGVIGRRPLGKSESDVSVLEADVQLVSEDLGRCQPRHEVGIGVAYIAGRVVALENQTCREIFFFWGGGSPLRNLLSVIFRPVRSFEPSFKRSLYG